MLVSSVQVCGLGRGGPSGHRHGPDPRVLRRRTGQPLTQPWATQCHHPLSSTPCILCTIDVTFILSQHHHCWIVGVQELVGALAGVVEEPVRGAIEGGALGAAQVRHYSLPSVRF